MANKRQLKKQAKKAANNINKELIGSSHKVQVTKQYERILSDEIGRVIEPKAHYYKRYVGSNKYNDASFILQDNRRIMSSIKKAAKAGNSTYTIGNKKLSEKQVSRILDNIEKRTKKTMTDSGVKSQKFKVSHKTVEEAAKDTTKKAAKEAAEETGGKALKWLKDNKVGQIALGVGVTAWLVNKLSDSRGQQSNGQLYGQGGGY